jgi:hypothetical protein
MNEKSVSLNIVNSVAHKYSKRVGRAKFGVLPRFGRRQQLFSTMKKHLGPFIVLVSRLCPNAQSLSTAALDGHTFFKKLKRVVSTVPVVLALFCGVLPQLRGDVVLEPPGAIVAGKSIAAWSTNWWRWAAALAPPGDPFTDTTGQFANVNQSGPVFFSAGSPGGSRSRHFRVPADTYVLVPLLVGEYSQLELGFGNTADQVRQAAQQQANQIDSLHAILDGVPISQTVLFTHRETSPDFNFYAVYNNQVGINASGNSGIAVADGYFLMIDPLTPGTHTLNYGGGASTLGALADETDVISIPPSPIPLYFQRVNNTLVLTWTNAAFSLQRANDINGPYTTLGAISNGVSLLTSPYTNTLTFGPEFFRLQAINMP